MKVKRSYHQFCALARALDAVGERWTLLIVRELLLGPRRYTDLLRNLPGIGTNLLADRLKELERSGVVRRTELPAPASGSGWELTEHGRELEPALIALARFGMSPIAPPRPEDEFRPGWYVLAMQAAFRPEAAGGVRETYEFRLDGEVFHLRVEPGEAAVRQGPAERPALVVETRSRELLALLSGMVSPAQLERSGGGTVRGERAARDRWLRAFALPEPLAA